MKAITHSFAFLFIKDLLSLFLAAHLKIAEVATIGFDDMTRVEVGLQGLADCCCCLLNPEPADFIPDKYCLYLVTLEVAFGLIVF